MTNNEDRRCRRHASRADGQGVTRCTKEGAYWQSVDGQRVWLCREPCSFECAVTDEDMRFLFIPRTEAGDRPC